MVCCKEFAEEATEKYEQLFAVPPTVGLCAVIAEEMSETDVNFNVQQGTSNFLSVFYLPTVPNLPSTSNNA